MAFGKTKAPKAGAEEQTAKKTAGAKKADKPKKAAPKKVQEKETVTVTVQYLGKELTQADLVAAVKAQLGTVTVKTMELYVKPEDNAVYYVVNGDVSGKIDV